MNEIEGKKQPHGGTKRIHVCVGEASEVHCNLSILMYLQLVRKNRLI